jgi:hypothetical protein
MKKTLFVSITSLALLTGGVLLSSSPVSATGTVPTDVQKGIDDSKATVTALNGLSITALTVALTPMGAMLTLRFLNMVLSRV